jgi:hypothetical protein
VPDSTTLSGRATRRKHVAFSGLSAATLVSAVAVWSLFPHQQQLSSVWVLFAKLVPVVFATEAIAVLDVDLVRRRNLAMVAMPVVFVVFVCYFAPRIFFLSSFGTFDQLYFLVITMLPYTVLALVLCYRMGGGSSSHSRRLSYGMLLLMLSGLEDLAFLKVNHHSDPRFTSIPEHWTWASHINVFFGGPVSKHQAYVFIAIHITLALTVLFLPARAFRRLRPSGGSRTSESAPGGPVASGAPVLEGSGSPGGR